MAFLLGNESCIESLRNDLKDIQETIDDILNNHGPIKCYSWKCPDKLATDLQIFELINRYQYTNNDEVTNQISHYSLLELIIDRNLAKKISNVLAENSLFQPVDAQNCNPTNKINRLSAGLGIKKYWSKFSQLNATIRHLNCQKKISIVKKKQTDENKMAQSIQPSFQQNHTSAGSINIKYNKMPSTNNKISNEINSKSIQTNETAFVPCESCAKIQKNLQQNADQIINMCHYQKIISHVGKYRTTLMSTQLVGGWLNGDDLEKWLNEQDKDLVKLGKELDFLNKNNELIKVKLSENEKAMNKMIENEKEIKKNLKEEQDIRSTTIKQYEKKLSEQKIELENKLKKLDCDLEDLNKKYFSLKEFNENNEKLNINKGETNISLCEEIKIKSELNDRVKKLEDEKLILFTETDFLKREIAEKSNVLANERLKLDNLIRSEQSLKSNYEALNESFDKKTTELESLKLNQSKFNDYKLEIESLNEKLKLKEKNIENLKNDNDILNNKINDLKIEIQKQKENERLLLSYPDLYGPIEQINLSSIEQNVCDDMLNQINANKYRINLLQNLNKKLFNSIKKLNETQVDEINNSYSTKISSLNIENIESNHSKDYFLKRRQEGSIDISKNNTQLFLDLENSQNEIVRPIPLFKLENEIVNPNISHASTRINLTKDPKFWNSEESLANNNLENSINSSKMTLKRNQQELLNSEINNDDKADDDYNFLKDKERSDQDYLQKLNQINLTSELKIENNSDFSFYNYRRKNSSGTATRSFLQSPSQSSLLNSDRNNSRISNYSTPYVNHKQSNRTPLPIPPADKNMEVIVGKGRRVNSASGLGRTNQIPKNTNIIHSNGLSSRTQTPNNKNVTIPKEFKCDDCKKKYNNIKDLDIHKLYCNK